MSQFIYSSPERGCPSWGTLFSFARDTCFPGRGHRASATRAPEPRAELAPAQFRNNADFAITGVLCQFRKIDLAFCVIGPLGGGLCCTKTGSQWRGRFCPAAGAGRTRDRRLKRVGSRALRAGVSFPYLDNLGISSFS